MSRILRPLIDLANFPMTVNSGSGTSASGSGRTKNKNLQINFKIVSQAIRKSCKKKKKFMHQKIHAFLLYAKTNCIIIVLDYLYVDS